MTRTAIYCRVSTPGQKNTTSLPEQERISREHAATLGWDVSRRMSTMKLKAAKTCIAPAWIACGTPSRRHEIDGVVIDVLDRSHATRATVARSTIIADRFGVSVELASEDIDETEQGRNLRTLTGIMARMERVEIRRRTQRGRKARVAAGQDVRWARSRSMAICGPTLTRASARATLKTRRRGPLSCASSTAVADGVSIRQIARELEAEGVPTPFQILAARGMLPKGRTASPIWGRGTDVSHAASSRLLGRTQRLSLASTAPKGAAS